MGKELDRPRVLTDKVQQELVRLIAEGNYLEPACRAVGITKQTFHYWKNLYEAGVEHAQIYADFFDAFARAQGIAETNALGSVRSGRMGWQGEAWFLERRYRGRWGNKQKTELTVKGEGGTFERIDNPRDTDISPSAETEGVCEK